MYSFYQKLIPNAIIGLYLSNNSDTLSELTLGYLDSKMVKQLDVQWEATEMPETWSIEISHITIGSRTFSPSVIGVLSGKPYLGVPLGDLYYTLQQTIITALNPHCIVNLNTYGAIVCKSDVDLSAYLPNITMSVMHQRFNITITPNYYIYNQKVDNVTIYTVAIIPIRSDDAIILGTPFLNRVYTVLDFDLKNVGLVS